MACGHDIEWGEVPTEVSIQGLFCSHTPMNYGDTLIFPRMVLRNMKHRAWPIDTCYQRLFSMSETSQAFHRYLPLAYKALMTHHIPATASRSSSSSHLSLPSLRVHPRAPLLTAKAAGFEEIPKGIKCRKFVRCIKSSFDAPSYP